MTYTIWSFLRYFFGSLHVKLDVYARICWGTLLLLNWKFSSALRNLCLQLEKLNVIAAADDIFNSLLRFNFFIILHRFQFQLNIYCLDFRTQPFGI